jgi:hypothetical protein
MSQASTAPEVNAARASAGAERLFGRLSPADHAHLSRILRKLRTD